jgi:hypothetical protein
LHIFSHSTGKTSQVFRWPVHSLFVIIFIRTAGEIPLVAAPPNVHWLTANLTLEGVDIVSPDSDAAADQGTSIDYGRTSKAVPVAHANGMILGGYNHVWDGLGSGVFMNRVTCHGNDPRQAALLGRGATFKSGASLKLTSSSFYAAKAQPSSSQPVRYFVRLAARPTTDTKIANHPWYWPEIFGWGRRDSDPTAHPAYSTHQSSTYTLSNSTLNSSSSMFVIGVGGQAFVKGCWFTGSSENTTSTNTNITNKTSGSICQTLPFQQQELDLAVFLNDGGLLSASQTVRMSMCV